MRFHEKLSKLIDERGRYASTLARALNVTPTTIKNWRDGLHDPSLRQIETIADHFGVPIGWFVDPRDSRSLDQVEVEEGWLRDLRRLPPQVARDRILGIARVYPIDSEESRKAN